MKKTSKITLEFDNYIITYETENGWFHGDYNAKIKFKDINKESKIYHSRIENKGELFYNLQLFNGYFFLDTNDILYDTIHKKVYLNNYEYFIGDEKEEAFVLFENQKLIEKKIKEAVQKMNENSDKKMKYKIEEEIIRELEEELENFNFENFKFKNGKYYEGDDYLHYDIKDSILEEYHLLDKEYFVLYKGEFIQKNFKSDYRHIDFFLHGKGYYNDYNKNRYECEFFYGYRIGRGKSLDVENKQKFFFNFNFDFNVEGNTNIYYNDYFISRNFSKELITLEINNQERNNPGKILIKDINGEKIIYEINVNVKLDDDYAEPEGIGIVKDYRNGEILIVNFNNNNIISNNLKDLSLFINKEEFDMNKES